MSDKSKSDFKINRANQSPNIKFQTNPVGFFPIREVIGTFGYETRPSAFCVKY